MHAHAALELCLELPGIDTVLDVGAGEGLHADVLRAAGKTAYECDIRNGCRPYPHCGAHLESYDLVWASHVLEHQRDMGEFLDALLGDAKNWLAITVPPRKDTIVGGHVTLWNAGLLLYNLVLAGNNCAEARVKTYGYNVSVVVPVDPITLPPLKHDHGDLETLARYLPVPVVDDSFAGVIDEWNWQSSSADQR